MTDAKIFISYRRADSAYAAGRLYDRLSARFGEEQVFMDVEHLDPGVNFVEAINRAVSECNVLLALIGPQWLTAQDEKGNRRLDNPLDFVRLEIAAALEREIRIIPILLQGTMPPKGAQLPQNMRSFAQLNALEIRHERFNADADRLARAIGTYLKEDAERQERETLEKKARQKAKREQQEKEAAQHSQQITDDLTAADAALQAEDWATARNHYRQILALQPEHTAAQAGLRVALDRLELAKSYGQALLHQDASRLPQALRLFRQVQAKAPNYEDIPERIAAITETLAAQKSAAPTPVKTTPSRQDVQRSIAEFLQALPRWLLYGIGGLGLIGVIALACWGGNSLLTALRSGETPQPTLTTPVAIAATHTEAQRPTTDVEATQTDGAVDTPAPTQTSMSEPSHTPSPTPEVLPIVITDDFDVPMALIPAGSFEMGSNAGDALAECQKFRTDCERGWFEDEEPVHTVTLDDFYIDQYEVTNARYAECVAAGECDLPSSTSSYSHDSYYDNADYSDYPVLYVSWLNASTYCEWRGARLPTEAEWEYAARGSLEGALYPWGSDFDGTQANFCDTNCDQDWANSSFDDGYTDTAPVGSYPPNNYGLYDMAGNVWEWTADWYGSEYYANSPESNPTGPARGDSRVLRGGSWSSGVNDLQAASRVNYSPSLANYDVGFRCARSP